MNLITNKSTLEFEKDIIYCLIKMVHVDNIFLPLENKKSRINEVADVDKRTVRY